MAGGGAYDGANYGLDPEYGAFSQTYSSNPAYSSGIGLNSDPRTANIIKAVSEKLNTGANVVEITQLSSETFESIPKQHFDEVNRLRKLVGKNVELTVHAPVIEPTGMTKRGWNPYEREQAEMQMFNAVQKAHSLNPDGNVVTTFHSSAIGMPEETRIWEEVTTPEGEKKKVEVVKEALVIDERTGEIAPVSGKLSPFLGETKVDIQEKIKKINEKNWNEALYHINFASEQAAHNIKESMSMPSELEGGKKKEMILKEYKDYAEGKGDKFLNDLKEIEPAAKEIELERMQAITSGDIRLRDAYGALRDQFDKAYSALSSSTDAKAGEDLAKLNNFRDKIAPKLKNLTNPENIIELADTIKEGVHVLRSIEAPQQLKPFKDFAINQSSETFSNVALKAYKEFGDNAPVISIENPPVGFALSRADELKKLVEESRRKFEQKAVEKLGLTQSQAEEQSQKLIGATWDVGHINMMRKYGAGTEEVVKETKKIAPLVKHVHLSDNFGMEHTELPMGMGNVPTEGMLKEIMKHNAKVKKIAEIGSWYQHFQSTPFGETLQNFGSPIYAMQNQDYWRKPSYFSGYGQNPEIHHSMYGAGFANLPVELGGQMSGRSRVSGAPME